MWPRKPATSARVLSSERTNAVPEFETKLRLRNNTFFYRDLVIEENRSNYQQTPNRADAISNDQTGVDHLLPNHLGGELRAFEHGSRQPLGIKPGNG